jgi:hypothetical protein
MCHETSSVNIKVQLPGGMFVPNRIRVRVRSLTRDEKLPYNGGMSEPRNGIHLFTNADPNEVVTVEIKNISSDKIWNVRWNDEVAQIGPGKKTICELRVSGYDHKFDRGNTTPVAYVILNETGNVGHIDPDVSWNDLQIAYTIKIIGNGHEATGLRALLVELQRV